MREQVSDLAGQIFLRISGRLDAAAAHALDARLDQIDRRSLVVVDLGAVHDVDHVALAILASDLARRQQPHVALRGLCEHHVRMLRYFGFEIGAAPGGAVTALA